MKFKKLITSALVAISLFATLSTSAFATGGIDSSGAGLGFGDSEVVAEDMPRTPGMESDIWELSLYYFDTFQGSGLLIGPMGYSQMETLGCGGGICWVDSKGTQLYAGSLSEADSFGEVYFPDVSYPWSQGGVFKDWGRDPENMKEKLLFTVNYGSSSHGHAFNNAAYQKLKDMIDECTSGEKSYAELQAMVDAKTAFPFFVSARPHLPAFLPTSSAGSEAGAQLITRERLYNIYKNYDTKYYFNMYRYLCNPWFTETQEAHRWGQPDQWTVSKQYVNGVKNGMSVLLNGVNDYRLNYVIFWFDPLGQETTEEPEETPDPDPIPLPDETGFPEMHIYEWELVAGFLEEWQPDTEGNIYGGVTAEGSKSMIKIQEKALCWPTQFIHNNSNRTQSYHCYHSGSCRGHSSSCWEEYEYYCDDEDCTRCPHEDEYLDCKCTCGGTGCWNWYYPEGYCHWDYWFKWTPDPTGTMQESKLESLDNIQGNTAQTTIKTWNNYKVNKYELTRVGNDPDLKLHDLGQVYVTWKWVNNVQVSGPGFSDWGMGSCYNARWNVPNGSDPEPFESGFNDEFNAHRMAKHRTNSQIATTIGERAIIPMAGYMMNLDGNIKYKEWAAQRVIDARILWYMNEDNSSWYDAMYKGSSHNVSWGHGGDWGTTTGDSDMEWPNDWQWKRAPQGSGGGGGAHTTSSTTTYHKDTLGSPTHNSIPMGEGPTQSAEAIRTPRAVFQRTLIVDDSVTAETQPHTHDEIVAYVRHNQYGNDRLTFSIPSTIFMFSPTYKMYADFNYTNGSRPSSHTSGDYTPVWVLAHHTETMQFTDIIDVNLLGCETVVKSRAWSNDYEDRNLMDPNGNGPIQVVKAGDTYNVETGPGKLVVTAVVHLWDNAFWDNSNSNTNLNPQRGVGNIYPNPAQANNINIQYELHGKTPAKDDDGGIQDVGTSAIGSVSDNSIMDSYMQTCETILDGFNPSNIGWYTNLAGGCGTGTDQATAANGKVYERFCGVNPILKGGSFTHPVYGTTMNIDPSIIRNYAKLRLTTNTVSAKTHTKTLADQYRLDGLVDGWDSKLASESGITNKWTKSVFDTYINDNPSQIPYDCVSAFQGTVLGTAGANNWLVEDYEGIVPMIIQYEKEIDYVRSNDAQVYEHLSDFKSSLNAWSPQVTSPNVAGECTYGNFRITGGGEATVRIEEGSVAAGMAWALPDFEVYPDGIDGSKETMGNWIITVKPDYFGVRGSTFDK